MPVTTRRHPARSGRLGWACDRAGRYDGGHPPPSAGEPAGWGPAREALTAGADLLGQVDLDLLSERELEGLLGEIQQLADRLSWFRTVATGTLRARRRRRAGPGREAGADRDTQRFLTDQLRLPPSEAKKLGRTSDQLRGAPQTSAAFERGELGPDHAAVITETLRDLHGPVRDQLEAELTELASRTHPVALGRAARRRLAELDQDAAVKGEDRRHARRYARITPTADGMVAIHALLAGVPAEAAMTALHAFTAPDRPGAVGTREQRAADALGDIFLAALQTGEAPTQHGVRPQVNITVDLDDLQKDTGAGELDWTGPLPISELRRWLHDAHIRGLVLDPDTRIPVTVTGKRPNIPAHLWASLCVRDRGCRYPGCDRPPAWCDAAHVIPIDRGGPTHLSGLVLLCRQHHRQIDRTWTITISGNQVRFHHPDGRTLTSDPPTPSGRRGAPRHHDEHPPRAGP
jgi:hypothetical protein